MSNLEKPSSSNTPVDAAKNIVDSIIPTELTEQYQKDLQLEAEIVSLKADIRAELEQKVWAEKTNEIMGKIEESSSLTWWMKVKEVANRIERVTGAVGKPSTNPEGMQELKKNISEFSMQITTITATFSAITKQVSDIFSFGKDWSGNDAIDEWVDQTLQKLEEFKAKEESIMTKEQYLTWVAATLSSFLETIKTPSALDNTPDNTPVVAWTWSPEVDNRNEWEEEYGVDDDYTIEYTENLAWEYPIGLPITDFDEKKITGGRRFGPRTAPKAWASSDHKWIDIPVPEGTDILAPADGKVIAVKDQPGGAWLYVDIDHGSFITRYMHLSKQDVREWDIVKKWDTFALSGNTGVSTGPHLHYEIRYKWEIVDTSKKNVKKYKAVDPMEFIDFNWTWEVLAMNEYKLANTPDNRMLA